MAFHMQIDWQQEYRNRWRILAAILIGGIMGPIDASVVNIAFPTIASAFHVQPSTVGWVSMAYLLALSSLLLSFGRLGDMFGFKRLYINGLLLFTISSIACGAAPNLGALVAFRAIQAIGAGMTMATAPAIITAVFPPAERGRALGMNGMSVALGLALGPSLGGLLVSSLGWRSIFYINVPVGLIAYILSQNLIPDVKTGKVSHSFDWPGSLLAALSLTSLLVFVSRGQAMGWSWPVLFVGGTAVVSGISFIYAEKSRPEPMLDLSLFNNRIFSTANVAALLNFMTQYVVVFSTPFLLQRALDYPAARAGIVMTAFPLTVLLIAPIAGILSDRIGHRIPAFLGSSLCTLAALALVSINTGARGFDIAWRLSLFGLGTGLFQSPNNSAVMGSVPRDRLGTAGGVLATTRNVGMVAGIAIAGAIFAWRESLQVATGREIPFLIAIKNAYLAAGVLSGLATITCLVLFTARMRSKSL